MTESTKKTIDLSTPEGRQCLLQNDGPVCLIIKAALRTVGDIDRFQPAGFPEIGHVIYDAPRERGTTEKVCIVDSPASMANHLETVCTTGLTGELHLDLEGLPYVRCVTDTKRNLPEKDDKLENVVCTSLTEGHRVASDYFLDGLIDRAWVGEEKKTDKGKEEIVPAHWGGNVFRAKLRKEFTIIEVKEGKTYFIPPQTWWSIYKTIFKYDPNSLVHGVMFAKEQIKISRILTAHLEAFGASRVGRSGVKFDRLGKTTSGQPIFAVDEETAKEIRATFILDLALLRSYGRGEKGLAEKEKQLVLDLALWKIGQLLDRPFRYRTDCFLSKQHLTVATESQKDVATQLPAIDIKKAISACNFGAAPVTDVYYPSEKLYKTGTEEGGDAQDGVEAASPDEDNETGD